jgi:DNA repair photolyase
MLRKAAGRGIPVYAAIAPVLPYHGHEEMKALAQAVSDLPLTEVYCEVLNPKDGNLAMVRAAHVRDAADEGRDRKLDILDHYTDGRWAAKTLKTMFSLRDQFPGGIYWPDTGRGWAKSLSVGAARLLDKWLPAKEAAHV